MEKTLCCLTPMAIRDRIGVAKDRVAYAAPGLTDAIAKALITAYSALGPNRVDVVVDLDPEVCRLGYGMVEAVVRLSENGLAIRKAPGLRIGVLIIDGSGWIFSTPPLLVEDIRRRESEPNAVAVTKEQAEIIFRAIASDSAAPPDAPTRPVPGYQDRLGPSEAPVARAVGGEQHRVPGPPEIGTMTATVQEIASVRRDLEQNPPQRFDLARKVRVFNSAIEFVELELRGAQIQRRRISLPRELFAAVDDEETRNRISAVYSLIDPSSALSSKTIDRKVANLRRTFLRNIPQRGQVMLRTKRPDFEAAMADVKKVVAEFQEQLRGQLDADLEKSKTALVNAIVPSIARNPPPKLRHQIIDEVTDEDARKYVEELLNREFPTVDELISDMFLGCTFKGVTYETLADPKFQEQVKRNFRFVDFETLFQEFDAAKAIDV
jgi:hypothetical protein